jgi:hypothetical protein
MVVARVPLPTVKSAGNTCNGCTECCVGFPLLPNPDFWPEGKRAMEPCRFKTETGCGIHDQPRPKVCTDFLCCYLDWEMPEAYWPKATKVIPVATDLLNLNGLGALDDNALAAGLAEEDPVLWLLETEPRAALRLDPARLSYYLRKRVGNLDEWWWAVSPCGTEPPGWGDRGGGLLVIRSSNPSGRGLIVRYENDEHLAYAEELRAWWSQL